MKLPLKQPYKQFFGTLANQVRLDIIEYLSNTSSSNVSELVSKLQYTQPTISHSLKRLRTCGFVTVKQTGRERSYSLNKETIQPLFKLMHHHMHGHCQHIIGDKK